MKKPNFFIVGAPKCGTTALYDYLGQHPNIYIPDTSTTVESLYGGKKELHFFGQDLNFSRPSLEEYLEYYKDAGAQKRLGESSVFYLYSQTAAKEIKEFCPTARIIIMLRNPVDMMYSWYSQLHFWGDESLDDFSAALDAEPHRKQGRHLPSHHDHPIECFFYTELAKFHNQVKRYFDIFGRGNVKVIIFDDFKQNVVSVYQQTLDFLECDRHFQPDFAVVNSNKTVRSKLVRDFLKRPPATVKILKKLIPVSWKQSMRGVIQRKNVIHQSRVPMNIYLRSKLQSDFSNEIIKLSELLEKDLSHWLQE